MASPARRRPRPNMAFVGWAWAIFVVGSVAMLVICRHVTGGRIIYVVDDAAIHLSVAETLLRHGTWGVQPGVYQSVSSSPLWGAMLAGALWLTRARDVLPWVLNIGAGLWLIWAVGSRQQALRPSRRAPLSVVATAGLITVALFLPALTMVGMEHLLHAAMVVQLLAWIHDRARPTLEVGSGQPSRTRRVPAWAPYLLASLAVVTRFETMWVVAGIGLGYLIDGWATGAGPDRSGIMAIRIRTVAGLGAATALPVIAYGAFNRGMGQGFLPNSVLAKSAASSSTISISPEVFLSHLTADPLVAVLLLAAIGYLAVAANRPATQSIVPAVTVVVAVVAHSLLAQFGYWERYQAYLIALGLYFILSAASEFLADRTTVVAVLALAALLFTPVKWSLLVETPEATDNTYAQRYQAALFVQRYYRGRSVATGELGYISLLHRGPVIDVLGLGNYQVLQHRQAGTDNQAFYADLARRADVQIAVMYAGALGRNRTPSTWFLVADWQLQPAPVSTLLEPYQFWATSPAAARQLRADLIQNTPRLPPHVNQYLNGCLDTELDQPPVTGPPGAGPADAGPGAQSGNPCPIRTRV